MPFFCALYLAVCWARAILADLIIIKTACMAMDKKFLMGNGDFLKRAVVSSKGTTTMSPELRLRLYSLAINHSIDFFQNALSMRLEVEYNQLAKQYLNVLDKAYSLGLFTIGGVREKDHLHLWCLAQVLQPKLYVESGVFMGSSLHAMLSSGIANDVVAIDPNLDKLKLNKSQYPNVQFIDDQDFSQITLNNVPEDTLAYFDDHINTAARIHQAAEKGIKYLVFDDSTGFEGVCQRLYPAIPTLPMIMHPEVLVEGEQMSWFFTPSQKSGLSVLGKKPKTHEVTLEITADFIDTCMQTKSLIKSCTMLPNLGEFIPQRQPEKMLDNSKYLVLLK